MKNVNGDIVLVVVCVLEDGKVCEEMVKILVDVGADASAFLNGMASVYWVCVLGYCDVFVCMVDVLLMLIVNFCVEDGLMLLFVVVEYGKIEVIRWLFERGDVDAMVRNVYGCDVFGVFGVKMC